MLSCKDSIDNSSCGLPPEPSATSFANCMKFFSSPGDPRPLARPAAVDNAANPTFLYALTNSVGSFEKDLRFQLPMSSLMKIIRTSPCPAANTVLIFDQWVSVMSRSIMRTRSSFVESGRSTAASNQVIRLR